MESACLLLKRLKFVCHNNFVIGKRISWQVDFNMFTFSHKKYCADQRCFLIGISKFTTNKCRVCIFSSTETEDYLWFKNNLHRSTTQMFELMTSKS